MKDNKHIEREEQSATHIFDNRSLKVDYRTLEPILKKCVVVLDVGFGTGAISNAIAAIVGKSGSVTGIDNTERFIEIGKVTYKSVEYFDLIHCDLFDSEPKQKFDLIVAARMLQWLSNPK